MAVLEGHKKALWKFVGGIFGYHNVGGRGYATGI